jgi:hypothetical protein
VGFAKAFTNAINLGGVLTISSAWEGVTYQECCSAMHKAFEDFTSIKKMQASLEATPLPIAQEALKALQAAAAQKRPTRCTAVAQWASLAPRFRL